MKANQGRRKLFAAVVIAVVVTVAWSLIVWGRSLSVKNSYAKAWSGRLDGALDFRLSSKPSARYLLLAPPGYDPNKKYQLWVSLHGIVGGAEEGLCEWYWYAKKRGVFLLAPHGSHQLQTNNKLNRHLAYWDYENDPTDIVDMIREVKSRYSVDDQNVVLFGTSSGATMALAVASRVPNQVAFLGLYSFEWGPQEGFESIGESGLKVASKRAHMFFSGGLADANFDKSSFDSSIASLRGMGFQVEALAWPGVGHDDRPFREETMRCFDSARGKPTAEPSWVMNLSGLWRAKFVMKLAQDNICHDDPGPSKQALAMITTSYDDRLWQEVPVPLRRPQWKGDWSNKWDGETVLRKQVNIPSAEAGKDLTVNLGFVESIDQTYFNGVQIGSATNDDPYYLWKPRIYTIPGALVHRGNNLLAVRLFDRCGGGGMSEAGPGELRLYQKERY
jgi:predicted esterase